MKINLLTAVSVLALMAAGPVLAENLNSKSENGINTNHATGQRQPGTVTKEDIKQGWRNTKAEANEAADDISDATHEAYEDVKAAFIDEDADAKPVTFNTRISASGMIGKPVY